MATMFVKKDDIFDEDSDELAIDCKNWEKIHNARIKEGFRDGVTFGEDNMLQRGFNDGFTQNTSLFQHLAKMRGFVCGLLGFHQTNVDNRLPSVLMDKLELFVQKLSHIEQEWMKTCGKPNSLPERTTERSVNQSKCSKKGSTDDASKKCIKDSTEAGAVEFCSSAQHDNHGNTDTSDCYCGSCACSSKSQKCLPVNEMDLKENQCKRETDPRKKDLQMFQKEIDDLLAEYNIQYISQLEFESPHNA